MCSNVKLHVFLVCGCCWNLKILMWIQCSSIVCCFSLSGGAGAHPSCLQARRGTPWTIPQLIAELACRNKQLLTPQVTCPPTHVYMSSDCRGELETNTPPTEPTVTIAPPWHPLCLCHFSQTRLFFFSFSFYIVFHETDWTDEDMEHEIPRLLQIFCWATITHESELTLDCCIPWKQKLAAPPPKGCYNPKKRQRQQNQERVDVNLLKTQIQTTWIQTHKTVWTFDEANCNK